MKKILIVILAILLLPLFALPIYAQEKTMSLPRGMTNAGNYMAASDRIEISGTVDGDAYVAGGMVRVDGTINRDLLAAGGDIIISGTVNEDVRITGGNITFSGATVNGNVTVVGGQVMFDRSTNIKRGIVALGGNITVLSPVANGITGAVGNMEIGNSVGGDIYTSVGQLSLLPNAAVNGNLTYISNAKANISPQATVSGTINQQLTKTDPEKAGRALAAGLAGLFFIAKIVEILMLILLGILFIIMFPIYSARTVDIARNRFWLTLLVGIIGVIITPIAAVVLMATLIGIPLGILILIIYGMVLWFAKIAAINAFSQIMINRNKVKNRIPPYLLGVGVYFLISLLPPLVFLTDLAIMLIGTGIILMGKKEMYSLLRTKKLI